MAKNAPQTAEDQVTETPEATGAKERPMVIAGIEFTVSLPYAEGHTISAVEAKVLNQTRCENISNAMRKKIEELKVDGEYTEEAVAQAAALVAEYDANYEFAAGGSTRRTTDPLEKEALSIARAEVTRQIKAMGKKVKDIDEAVIEQNVEAFAAHPDVLALARKRLEERSQLSSGLNLSI